MKRYLHTKTEHSTQKTRKIHKKNTRRVLLESFIVKNFLCSFFDIHTKIMPNKKQIKIKILIKKFLLLCWTDSCYQVQVHRLSCMNLEILGRQPSVHNDIFWEIVNSISIT